MLKPSTYSKGLPDVFFWEPCAAAVVPPSETSALTTAISHLEPWDADSSLMADKSGAPHC